jgi:hypothetical protein
MVDIYVLTQGPIEEKKTLSKEVNAKLTGLSVQVA